MTFSSITKLKIGKKGFGKLKLVAKKTTARTVLIDDETVKAVLAYKQAINAKDEDVMFAAGGGHDPANIWVTRLNRFFKKHNMKVKSHDFRVTQATDFFTATKDIVAT